jgi:hypothetical protein
MFPPELVGALIRLSQLGLHMVTLTPRRMSVYSGIENYFLFA